MTGFSSSQKHRRRGRSKLDKLGIPEEELHRQQQQLFEEARQQQMEVSLYICNRNCLVLLLIDRDVRKLIIDSW